MPRFGYARVILDRPEHHHQLEKLKAADCLVIHSEKMSGKSADDLLELATVIHFLREGDELVVHLDRLGRSTRDVPNLVHELDQNDASPRILDPAPPTGGDVGRIVVTVLGMMAEMKRQRTDIEAARALDRDSGLCKLCRARSSFTRLKSCKYLALDTMAA